MNGGAVKATGAHTPRTLHLTPCALGPQQGARVPVGSHQPTSGLGISTAWLWIPVAAGAFLLGLPEGRPSERKALPVTSPSLGQVWYRQAAITTVLGWGGGPGSPNSLTCPSWAVQPKPQERGRKRGHLALHLFTLYCSTWTWLTLKNSCDLEQII